ncbi:MAG TPA: aminopeptidase P family protein, partial [Thermodesulfobacteriaceae bacterium]|nr:aminopeptidase P family protein [Thermodesulfobacteriaceae bacterium]
MVPETEIRERIGRLQKLLQEEGIELALLRQNADLYYFAGTVQDCHMLIPAVGDPILLVWRVCERAAAESPVRRIEPLHGLSRLREIVRKYRFDRPRKIGLEMDVLPAELYIYYTERVWPSTPVAGITHLVRTVRSRKSRWELEQIRSASDQIAGAVKQVPEILRPGITELEFASEIESVLRKTGHPGYLRMRGWNQEMGMGQILSGPEGAVPAWINTPAGGTGINPAFGQSSCLRRILPGEPVT